MGMCGIIFDLDGVLCYTDHYHYLAWKALADRLSLPFDEQVNNRLRGVSRMESLEIILSLGSKTYSQEEKEQMAVRLLSRNLIRKCSGWRRGNYAFPLMSVLWWRTPPPESWPQMQAAFFPSVLGTPPRPPAAAPS